MAENLSGRCCQGSKDSCRTMPKMRRIAEPRRAAVRTRTSATSRCSSRSRQLGDQQLFPVSHPPLNEKPQNHAVLGDITCDSDGKLDRLCRSARREEDAAAAHADRGRLLSRRVLCGAYQEDPGRPPQPLGDTHAVHVSWTSTPRQPRHADQGDTWREVLDTWNSMRNLLSKLRTMSRQRPCRAG